MDQPSYATQLRDAIARYLPHHGLRLLPDKEAERWTPRLLVVQAVVMSWALADSLKSAFAQAWGVVREAYDSRRAPGAYQQGFARHLARDSAALLGVVAPASRTHARRLAGRRHWLTHEWPAFGVDGSKVDVPRTAADEAAFGRGGREKSGPQQFVTTVFHLGTGLVWDFRRGDARASERAHLLDMLPALPGACLLVADAGFVGYELFRSVLGSGRHVLVRVGANVKLLTGPGWAVEEHDGVVYLWPKATREAGGPPLVLRLVTLLDGRNRRVHLLTDVLSADEMTDAEAGGIYRRRWGVELIYRALKQTMGKRKLRSRSPANAGAELEWAVVAFWMLGLLTLDETLEAGHEPQRVSVAAALRAVRVAAAGGRGGGCGVRHGAVSSMLSSAVKEDYVRLGPKSARAWPHRKRDKPPGDPKARKATAEEIAAARALFASWEAA